MAVEVKLKLEIEERTELYIKMWKEESWHAIIGLSIHGNFWWDSPLKRNLSVFDLLRPTVTSFSYGDETEWLSNTTADDRRRDKSPSIAFESRRHLFWNSRMLASRVHRCTRNVGWGTINCSTGRIEVGRSLKCRCRKIMRPRTFAPVFERTETHIELIISGLPSGPHHQVSQPGWSMKSSTPSTGGQHPQ